MITYYSGDRMKKNEIGVGVRHVWGRGEMHTGFWWGNLEEKDHLEDQSIGWTVILKWIFKEWEGGHGLD